MQDWVNFNIKSLGDITSQDSDSGFEQSTGKSTADYHSLYIEPWTDCHNNDPRRSKDRKNCGNQGDKVRIFVAGPSPKLERKKSYKSSGPNDERYYGELEILQIIQCAKKAFLHTTLQANFLIFFYLHNFNFFPLFL